MKTLYNKPIIAELSRTIGDLEIQVIIIQEGEYDTVHIITNKYQQDELNTLHLQDSKGCTEFTDDRLLSYAYGFFIWHDLQDLGIASVDLDIEMEDEL